MSLPANDPERTRWLIGEYGAEAKQERAIARTLREHADQHDRRARDAQAVATEYQAALDAHLAGGNDG